MKPLLLAALLLGSLLLARPAAGQGDAVLNVMEQAVGTAPQVMACSCPTEGGALRIRGQCQRRATDD